MKSISNCQRRLAQAMGGLCMWAGIGQAVIAQEPVNIDPLVVPDAPNPLPNQMWSQAHADDGDAVPPSPAAAPARAAPSVVIQPIRQAASTPLVPQGTPATPTIRPNQMATTPTNGSPCAQASAPGLPATTPPVVASAMHHAEATRTQTSVTPTELVASALLVSAVSVAGTSAIHMTAGRKRRRSQAQGDEGGREPDRATRSTHEATPISNGGGCDHQLPRSTLGSDRAPTKVAEDVELSLVPIPVEVSPPPGARPAPQVDLPPAMRIIASDQAAHIAKRWCDIEAMTPELFADLDLPGSLGSVFGPRAGMVSVTGPVRRRNEDAALLLSLSNGCTLLMSADGMGGHPDGHLASRLALVGVCIGLREALTRPQEPSSERMLQHAFSRARWLLRRATRAGHLRPGAGTTLIATLVESDHYVTAYLGDGGAYVRRADGSVSALMHVQKTEATRLDRYLASDSPARWRPEISRVARCRQDTLAIGSDGVMDRFDVEKVLAWLANHVATKGMSMQEAVQQLLAHFSQSRAEDGSPFADDNMTLLAVRMR